VWGKTKYLWCCIGRYVRDFGLCTKLPIILLILEPIFSKKMHFSFFSIFFLHNFRKTLQLPNQLGKKNPHHWVPSLLSTNINIIPELKTGKLNDLKILVYSFCIKFLYFPLVIITKECKNEY